ncbi:MULTISPECIES: GTP-binding protein [Aquimarina]|uniref:GTP-binding protein n=1 Tax=Aquimarina algiphila TaxID=2047982 RepID=A0A554VDG2_9FLAO|nr:MULTISPECIES: GTP-binding protein [Aquimarina]TSE04899.1 GTP-binding protein [Aquimarina algiphila]
MEVSNDIVLRPRFFQELNISSEKALDAFEKIGKTNQDFKISRVDHHVFIRIPKNKQHFWSPQLHLEIYDMDNGQPKLKGLFGPSPTVWTCFMFLHFIVAIVFISAAIWMYVNIRLDKPYVYPIVSMFFLIIIWFVLYFAGRIGRQAGKKEMRALYLFMQNTINTTSKI